MKSNFLFDYPNKLEKIFDKLNKNGIKTIIVGGYVRDKFLNLSSKDIDIELYGVSSFTQLEEILQEFGNINSVGKSFGVCKLSFENLEIDFTLPRTDNKIESGHRGFDIQIDKNLSFKDASSRRDFTINSIGFDTQNKKILDPFNGQEDIKNKIIRAVDIEKFGEDPLRVLRAVVFSSRFNFTLNKALFLVCKTMCDENILSELASERIYGEVKKILLKSPEPSQGFFLLKELNALKYFSPLNSLLENDFNEVLDSLDRFVDLKILDNKTNITLMLSILSYKFTKQEVIAFITNITNDKKVLKNILSLVAESFQESYTDSELLKLSCRVNIEYFLLISQAIHKNIDENHFVLIKQNAKSLDILNTSPVAYLSGKDILELGISPSKEYTAILNAVYEAQLNLEINSYASAKKWLQNYLVN